MKNVLIFNDISGLGNCSMSANLPIFSVTGNYCMPVPTACFSKQTGFEGFGVLDNSAVERFYNDISVCRAPDAVYVGFCNKTETLRVVCRVLSRTSGAFVVVDPIMGDNGKLYPVFGKAYAEQMKIAVKYADCITPNVTEACLLCDLDYTAFSSFGTPAFARDCKTTFADFLQKVGVKSAVITGIDCGTAIANLVLTQQGTAVVTNEKVPTTFSGTGDVFSSVLTATMLQGKSAEEATQIAADFVMDAAKATECSDRRFGIEFGRVLSRLIK